MKHYLIMAVAFLAALLAVQSGRLNRSKAECRRLAGNQTALMSDIEYYTTRAGADAASIRELRLRTVEFEELRAADARYIRDMGIKLKRVEATSKTATATIVELRTALRDTILFRPSSAVGSAMADTLRTFVWSDRWTRVDGIIDGDSVGCRIQSVDTLRQIVHRIPRRFLFFRWGTKAIRQEIVSSNPHTRIVYSEYVKIER